MRKQNQQRIDPDCATCALKETCERAQDGKFCPSWRSEIVKPAGKDPNDAWKQGEDFQG